jgi:hypothetical protein
MISEQDIQRAAEASARFKPAILSVKYHRDTDRVELQTPWCTLIIDRQHIEELRGVSQTDMETISVSEVGIHVDNANIDINSAGLITDVAKQLEDEVSNSF